MASVASFFISRIDTAVDAMINERLKAAAGTGEQALLRSLLGKVAIANAKQTPSARSGAVRGERWQALARKGAQTQRVLWASTSTKNPAYRDDVRRGAHRSRYRQHHAAGDDRRLPGSRSCAGQADGGH